MKFVLTTTSSFFILLAPRFAEAEVLDKLEVPWEPQIYVHMLVVMVCTGILAASARMPIRLAGLIAAIVWAIASLWADPWYATDLGNVLRAELTDEQRAQWLRTIWLQALAPLGVAVLVFLARTRTSRERNQSPR